MGVPFTASDNSAAPHIGVGRDRSMAVVVRGPRLETRHLIPLQGLIAYVLLLGSQDPPIDLRVHLHLLILPQAFPSYFPITGSLHCNLHGVDLP